MCACTDYLRSALDAQWAHLVHSHVAHVHALIGDLNGAPLEVLLLEDDHLDSWGKGEEEAECREREKRWTLEHPLRTGGSDVFASVCLLHLGHSADVRHLVLSCLPISLGSRLGFLSRHDDWGEEKSGEERGEEVKKWKKNLPFNIFLIFQQNFQDD